MLDTNTNNMITFVLEKLSIYNFKIHLDDVNPAFSSPLCKIKLMKISIEQVLSIGNGCDKLYWKIKEGRKTCKICNNCRYLDNESGPIPFCLSFQYYPYHHAECLRS